MSWGLYSSHASLWPFFFYGCSSVSSSRVAAVEKEDSFRVRDLSKMIKPNAVAMHATVESLFYFQLFSLLHLPLHSPRRESLMSYRQSTRSTIRSRFVAFILPFLHTFVRPIFNCVIFSFSFIGIS